MLTCLTGHFYLTQLLLSTLLSTASSTPSGKVRVVNTSSFGHAFVNHIDYETLKDGPKRVKLGAFRLYGQSKFVRLGSIIVVMKTRVYCILGEHPFLQ